MQEHSTIAVARSTALLTTVAAIPFVGPVLSQFISANMAEARFRRIEQFIELFDAKFKALRADKLDSRYAYSEDFAAYVAAAWEMAAKAHRREKIALLAAVAAGAAKVGTTDILRDKFLIAVDAIGSEHLALLTGAVRKNMSFTHLSGPVEFSSFPSVEQWIPDVLPSLTPEERQSLLFDLRAVGFMQEQDLGDQSPQRWTYTPLGQRFLEFIEEH